jgi:hypothetical protein
MKTALAFLLGLTIGICVHDPATVLRVALGASGGAAGAVLWWRRHGESERAQQAFLEALVSHGWHMGAKGTPETAALRIALPPKVTP